MNQTSLELTITGITRTCYTCGETKPITQFRKASKEKHGYAYECLECSRSYSRTYVIEHANTRNAKRQEKYKTDLEWQNHEKQRNTERNHKQDIKNQNRLRRDKTNSYKRAYDGVKNREQSSGKRKPKGFNISLEYTLEVAEQQNHKCALTGIPFNMKRTGDKEHDALLPSIDRINSTLGYVPGNIQWTTIWANTAKLNHTTKFFHQMCTATTRNLKNNRAEISE